MNLLSNLIPIIYFLEFIKVNIYVVENDAHLDTYNCSTYGDTVHVYTHSNSYHIKHYFI